MQIKNNDFYIVPLEHGTPEWLEARKGMVTGTLIGKLRNPTSATLDLFNGISTFKGNKHTQHGNKWEHLVRELANKLTGYTFTATTIKHNTLPFMFSPDGVNEQGTALVEIKIANSTESSIFKSADRRVVPKDHMDQMQSYIWGTGVKEGFYIVAVVEEAHLSINKAKIVDYRILKVVRDQYLINILVKGAMAFLENKPKPAQEIDSVFLEKFEAVYIAYQDIKAELEDMKQQLAEQEVEIKKDGLTVSKSRRKTTSWQKVVEDARVPQNIIDSHTTVKDSWTVRFKPKC